MAVLPNLEATIRPGAEETYFVASYSFNTSPFRIIEKEFTVIKSVFLSVFPLTIETISVFRLCSLM